MKNLKYILLTTVFIISFTKLFSAEQESLVINSLSLHIRITEITEHEAPFIIGGDLIFTYMPSKQNVRHVGISFENENFSRIYNLYKNENGVYFFIYKYPKEKTINYKFIEDGIWILDKTVKSMIANKSYIRLSSFEVPDKNVKEHISPIIENSTATFKMKAPKGSSIYITGDFNNWNPFLYKLTEEISGQYTITLNLPKGKFGYYFIYNGERVLDSENPFRGRSKIGEDVSLFTIN